VKTERVPYSYHVLRDASELCTEVSEDGLTHRLDILVKSAHFLHHILPCMNVNRRNGAKGNKPKAEIDN
jgi:hypothetical protein